MKKKPVRFMLIFSAFILFLFLIMQPIEVLHFRDYIAILFPDGRIALEQRNLMLILQAIMLLVVIPVYILTYFFSWKYRAHNPQGQYDPDLVDSKLAEVIWWGLPCVLTIVIAILTWQKTYELDPFKPLQSDKKPLTIQVVALQWKWLFIYPEERIATLNYLQFPEKTPIHFEITADAPMNSFWIPQLGGQIYAMPKMKTELNLIADKAGDFRGSSANLSGEGFAGMHFIARASSDQEYLDWVAKTKQSGISLDFENYTTLAKPSQNDPVASYQLTEDNLFNQILMKYMYPPRSPEIRQEK
jgi:cytochrome o ubiquinol oxidase subunit 2